MPTSILKGIVDGKEEPHLRAVAAEYANARTMLVGQAKNEDSPFKASDAQANEAVP